MDPSKCVPESKSESRSDDRGPSRSRSSRSRDSREESKFRPPEFVFVIKYTLDGDGDDALDGDGDDALDERPARDEGDVRSEGPRRSQGNRRASAESDRSSASSDSYSALDARIRAGIERLGGGGVEAPEESAPEPGGEVAGGDGRPPSEGGEVDSGRPPSEGGDGESTSSSSYQGSDPSNITQETSSSDNPPADSAEPDATAAAAPRAKRADPLRRKKRPSRTLLSVCSMLPPILEENSSDASRSSLRTGVDFSVSSASAWNDVYSLNGATAAAAAAAARGLMDDDGWGEEWGEGSEGTERAPSAPVAIRRPRARGPPRGRAGRGSEDREGRRGEDAEEAEGQPVGNSDSEHRDGARDLHEAQNQSTSQKPIMTRQRTGPRGQSNNAASSDSHRGDEGACSSKEAQEHRAKQPQDRSVPTQLELEPEPTKSRSGRPGGLDGAGAGGSGVERKTSPQPRAAVKGLDENRGDRGPDARPSADPKKSRDPRADSKSHDASVAGDLCDIVRGLRMSGAERDFVAALKRVDSEKKKRGDGASKPEALAARARRRNSNESFGREGSPRRHGDDEVVARSKPECTNSRFGRRNSCGEYAGDDRSPQRRESSDRRSRREMTNHQSKPELSNLRFGRRNSNGEPLDDDSSPPRYEIALAQSQPERTKHRSRRCDSIDESAGDDKSPQRYEIDVAQSQPERTKHRSRRCDSNDESAGDDKSPQRYDSSDRQSRHELPSLRSRRRMKSSHGEGADDKDSETSSTEAHVRLEPSKAYSKRHDKPRSEKYADSNKKISSNPSLVPAAMSELIKSCSKGHSKTSSEDIGKAIGILSSAIDFLREQDPNFYRPHQTGLEESADEKSEGRGLISEKEAPCSKQRQCSIADSSLDESIAIPPSESSNDLVAVAPTSTVAKPERNNVVLAAVPPWEDANEQGGVLETACVAGKTYNIITQHENVDDSSSSNADSSDDNSISSSDEECDAEGDIEEDESTSKNCDALKQTSTKRLLGLVCQKSLGRLSHQTKQEESDEASHGNQSQKQKASFINKVRHNQLAKSIPALLGDGILAVEGGVIAIEDGLHNLKMKAIERKHKANGCIDVPLIFATKIDDNYHMTEEKSHAQCMVASESHLTVNHSSSRETPIAHRPICKSLDRVKTNESSEGRHRQKDGHTQEKFVSTGMQDYNIDISNVVADRKSRSRRSSLGSLSQSSQSKNQHKGKLHEFYPRRSSFVGMNAFNTNDHGELISWDDLEDAIYVGLHNSLADIDHAVNKKQEWSHHFTLNDSTTTDKRNYDSHPSGCHQRGQELQRPGDHRGIAVVNKPASNQIDETTDETDSEGPWCCNKCTYLNENPLHLICGACNLPRYLELRS